MTTKEILILMAKQAVEDIRGTTWTCKILIVTCMLLWGVLMWRAM